MEQHIAPVIAELLKYGIAGIFIIYLIVKNWRLENDMKDKDEAHAKALKDSMENRVDEAIKTTVTLGANAAATEKMAEALSSMDERLRTTNENIAELSGRIGDR